MLSDATESNAQRNKLSLHATTSSGISHFRKTHLKRCEVVMKNENKLYLKSKYYKEKLLKNVRIENTAITKICRR